MTLLHSLPLLSVLASALVASVALAQDLFGGDNCVMDYPNFNSPPGSDFQFQNGKVTYDNGAMVMWLMPPPAGQKEGLNTLFTTSRALLYGTVEARLKQGPIGGVVTAFTLFNPSTKDELDWEFVGSQRYSAWTNFFYRGLRERNPVTTYEVWSSNPSISSDNHDNFHDYKIEWTPEYIKWSVDGSVVHTQLKSGTWEPAGTGDGAGYDHYHYPDSPVYISLGIWNDNDVAWSDGPLNWSDPSTANGFSASFASLKVTCYNGPIPPNTPPTSTQTATATTQTSTSTQTQPTTPATSEVTSGTTNPATTTSTATTTKPGDTNTPTTTTTSGDSNSNPGSTTGETSPTTSDGSSSSPSSSSNGGSGGSSSGSLTSLSTTANRGVVSSSDSSAVAKSTSSSTSLAGASTIQRGGALAMFRARFDVLLLCVTISLSFIMF